MSSVTDIRSHQRIARTPRPGSTLRGWLYRLGWHGALVDDRTRLDNGLARDAAAPDLPVLDPALQRRFRIRILGGIAFLLLCLVGSAWLMRHRTPAAPTLPAAPLVSIVVPHQSAVAGTVSFTGTISARYDQPIGLEGDGGRIAAVLVEAGDRVHQGQVLARLDTSVLAPQVASLEAALEQAKAESELAAADYKRALAVGPAGALSKEETDRRRSVAATAAAKVKVAEAQLAEAHGRLARTNIKASGDGIILMRRAEVGQTATFGGEPLFRLAKGGEVELRGQVAEQDLPKVKVGQIADVHVTGVSTAFPGKVWLVGAIIDPQTRLGMVRVSLTPHPDLRPGAFARAIVTTDHDQAIVLPQTAIQSDGTKNFVYIVGADNVLERRDVTVQGTSAEGVIISSGLKGNEQVISAAGAFLHAGDKVEPSGAARS
jgi:HlyD family secretion protein